MSDLDRLLRNFGHEGMALELLALGAGIGLAYLLCWYLGRRQPSDSVWFGRVLLDGVLFPLLALVFVYLARITLDDYQKVPVLRIAVTVLIALAGIRLIARVFTVVFPQSGLARLVERLFSWLAWLAAVLWIAGLLPAALQEMESIQFVLGKSKVSLLGLVEGLLSSGVVLVLALWISAAVERKVLRESVADLSLRKVAANTIRAVLLLVGFLFALSAAGVDLTALSVLGGALGVGLGFGLQKLAANYVSGFVLLSERSLRIGDTVRVDNFEGEVIDIKTRYTLIRAGNGRESIVPNEKLISERIENLSLADPSVLITTEVAVSYDADPDRVQEVLMAAATGAARVLAKPAPAVRLLRFGADGLEFMVQFWIANVAEGQANVKSEVNLRILRGLREAGIDIPYPQRVVRVISSGTAATGSTGETRSAPPA